MLQVPDGLSEIEHELPLVMEMIARTARWVHPDTFNALPVWCPDTARGRPRYDATWSRELISGRGVRKVEENIRAAIALMEALASKASPRTGPSAISGDTTTRISQGRAMSYKTSGSIPALAT